MGEYNICFSSDNNYIEQMGVAIASILKNSDKDDKFCFYILDGGIDKGNKTKIQALAQIKDFKISYIKMNMEDFKKCPLLKDYNKDFAHFHVPISTYFRFKMASLFPKLDKILYLDCDIVVLDSLKELCETDLTDNYVAMAPDVESENESERLSLPVYCNAGIMLANLAKWREDSIEEKLFDYAEKNKKIILWQDQDVLNVVLKDKIKILSRKWNFQFFQYDESRYEGLFGKYYEYNILHFAGRYKPWNNEIVHPLFNEYYLYLRLTPWKSNLINYKKQAFDKFFKSDIQSLDIYEEVVNAQKQIDEKYKQAEAVLHEEIVNVNKVSEVKRAAIREEIIKTQKQLEEKYKQAEIKRAILHEEIVNANIYTDDKIKETYSYLEENKADLYKGIEKVYKYVEEKSIEKVKENNTELYKDIEKVYKYAEEKAIEKVKENNTELFKDIEKVNQYTDIKTNELYKYTEEKVKENNAAIYDYVGTIENKISSVEYSSKLDLSDQKEFLNRLIQTKTDNLRSFFEEAIKTQLEIVNRTYENLVEQQKFFYEQKLENQTKYQENLLESKLENQKEWYENELNNQKQKFENEIQKQINENNERHINNLNERLGAQKTFYKNELDAKKEYYNSNLIELQDKLQDEISGLKYQIINLQDSLKESQGREASLESEIAGKETEIINLQDSLKESQDKEASLESEIAEKEAEIINLQDSLKESQGREASLESEIAGKKYEMENLNAIISEKSQQQEEQKFENEKELKDLKEYYELKIKPVSKLINLIDSKNKFLKKIVK